MYNYHIIIFMQYTLHSSTISFITITPPSGGVRIEKQLFMLGIIILKEIIFESMIGQVTK